MAIRQFSSHLKVSTYHADVQDGIFAVSLRNIFLEVGMKTHLLFPNRQKDITHVKKECQKLSLTGWWIFWPEKSFFNSSKKWKIERLLFSCTKNTWIARISNTVFKMREKIILCRIQNGIRSETERLTSNSGTFSEANNTRTHP